MAPGVTETAEAPAAPAPGEDALPAPHLELVSTTRNSVTLAWGPAALGLGLHRGGPGRMASTASQDSGPSPSPRPLSDHGHGPSPRPLSGLGQRPAPAPALSVESQGSVFDTDDRPDYRLQIREREKPWQTIYWGFKTRLELDNMAPGDSFHFRVQKGRGQWSSILAATTKDDQAPMIALHRAISQGLPHRARKFLSQRPLAVDVPDRAGRTALLLAVLRGDVELVYLLLNAGADPNHAAEGAANRTPLMLAAHRGALPLCRALRDRGARWDVPDRNGCTALHYAAAGCGSGPGGAAAAASALGTEEVVRMALEDGADVHARDSYDWTPLMRAVMLGAGTGVLTLLLEAGADILQLDKQGHTVAHLAALAGRQDVSALLARRGADLRTKSRYGHSARELGRCWPLSLANGANKGGIEAALAVAAAASTMLKKRAARRKQDELDDQI